MDLEDLEVTEQGTLVPSPGPQESPDRFGADPETIPKNGADPETIPKTPVGLVNPSPEPVPHKRRKASKLPCLRLEEGGGRSEAAMA